MTRGLRCFSALRLHEAVKPDTATFGLLPFLVDDAIGQNRNFEGESIVKKSDNRRSGLLGLLFSSRTGGGERGGDNL